MNAGSVIAISACTAILGWAAYHIVKGALEERERRYNEARLVMRVRAREEQEAREFAQAMARLSDWCREQSQKADQEIRELARLYELPAREPSHGI
jgi:hypothetical protein